MNVYLGAGIALVAASFFGFTYVTASVLLYTVQVFRTTVLMLLPETAVSLTCGIFGGYLIGISKGFRASDRSESAVSWFGGPRMAAFCAFKMLHRSLLSNTRVLPCDAREPVECFLVSAVWTSARHLWMVSGWLAQNVNAALVYLLLFYYAYFRFDEFWDSTFWTDVTFFRACHACSAFVTEFHKDSHGCIHRTIERPFYYTFWMSNCSVWKARRKRIGWNV